MTADKNNSDSPSLADLMSKTRGSYTRAANKLGCTPNWIWRVASGKVSVSTNVLEKVTSACVESISEIRDEASKKAIERDQIMRTAIDKTVKVFAQ